MNRKVLGFIICLGWICLSSCDRETQDPSLLVGTYRVIDQDIPYPFLLEKGEDSILLIDHKNKVVDRGVIAGTGFEAGDTLQMKEHSFFLYQTIPNILSLILRIPSISPFFIIRRAQNFGTWKWRIWFP